MMDDKTLRDTVERLSGYLESDSLFTDYEKDVLPSIITLAQRYLELSGVVREKGKEIIKGFADDVSCQLAEDYGYNEGRSDTLLAVMHRLEGLEGVARKVFEEHAEEDFKEVDKEVTEHGLLNPDSWDNKQAGFFDMEKYFQELATAIRNAISGGAEKGEL